jgi:hypothetical protein
MQAVSDAETAVEFDIFTTVPPWFFQDSVTAPFTYHEVLTDIGLAQKTAFQTDLPRTLRDLNAFLPFDKSLIGKLASAVSESGSGLIISDIAPLGIRVAKEVGIPSILVENFTWDWIYHPYIATDSRLESHISYLRDLFNSADYHIQTEPVCCPGAADLKSLPVSRTAKLPADQIRRRLQIPDGAKMVLVTSGGIRQPYKFLRKLNQLPDICFVLPGAGPEPEYRANAIILPHRSDYYHPDLVNAADVVVGKAGYSTLSEIYQAGVPFGYVLRSNFRESTHLANFIAGEMQGVELAESDFSSGKWISQLADLLQMKRLNRTPANGSDQIAGFIHRHIFQEHA